MVNLVNRLLRRAGYRELQADELTTLARLESAGCGEHYIAACIISDR